MKKLFLNLFVAGALTFGLQSCGEDEPCDDVTCPAGEVCDDGTCVTDPNTPVNTCDFCGDYSGTADGPMYIEAGGNVIVDTIFTDLPISSSINEISNISDSVDITVDITVNGIPLSPTVRGHVSGNRVTVTSQEWNYATLNIDVVVNGDLNFTNNNEVAGTLTLDEKPGTAGVNIDGTLTFEATKQ